MSRKFHLIFLFECPNLPELLGKSKVNLDVFKRAPIL